MRLTKALLTAAVAIGATVSTAKAYDMVGSGWNYRQPNDSQSFTQFDGNLFSLFWGVNLEADLADAGVYRGVSGSFTWSNNVFWDGDEFRPDLVEGEIGTNDSNLVSNLRQFDFGYDLQFNSESSSGSYSFNSASDTLESTNIALGQRFAGIWTRADGDEDSAITRSVTVFERAVQVARTGSGKFGANALSAFESDNSVTLSGSFYNANIVGRNVLPNATSGTTLLGSVVRQADIALGFFDSEGLFAKDGGWLDIRGDLTLGANGTIYIRDGEITSNIYTQFYSPGTLNTVGRLAIESGILSVREHFAQDMVATWNQTLGFRDGAVNESRLILEGIGYAYGFDGEGELTVPDGSSVGALRSITGNNIQNGNISVVADGEGFFPGGGNGAAIGTDFGSTLTINGTVNGLNSGGSEGGAFLAYFSAGNTIQNGRILQGIDSILKEGDAELLLTASNLFTGDLRVEGGSVRITNSGALSGFDGEGDTATYVDSGASLVLDQAAGLSLVDDIYISGTGQAGVGGALHNKTGANATTGNLWVDSTNGGPNTTPSSATVTVAASSSLTVANIRGASLVNTFTVDVSGAAATAGNFTVLGDTGAIDNIYKEGSGNATITHLAAELDDLYVNAGNLLVLGSEDSASDNIYDQLDMYGVLDVNNASVGSLEIRGNHHYGEFDFTNMNALIKGNITVHYNYDNDDIDLRGYTVVTVDAGATFTTNGFFDEDEEYSVGGDLEDNSKFIIKGTFNGLDDTFLDLDNNATLDIRAGGVVNSRVVADDNSIVTIAAASGGLGAGVLNGFVQAYDNATITLNGVINGDVETYGNATLTLGANAVHNGDYDAYGDATIIINGSIDNNEGNPLGQNFSLSGDALLKGSGTIGGNLTQEGGIVAPGNSTDILTVLGNYTISSGSLEIEIGGTEGPGNDPDGNDQLRVGGTVTVSGSAVLDFEPYNLPFESSRGNVFQVLATNTGAARGTIGRFDEVDLTGLNGRVLFDHSTGKAYGTGLAWPQGEPVIPGTFRDYGDNANRREIGRALWMESILHDNSGITDENFDDFAINNDGPGDETGQLGLKAFILTQPFDEVDETETATDLGAAAVSVLAAADVGAALDALSPEAFVGISELGVRVTRNFAQLPASKRKLAATNEWDFSVGYAGEQITAKGTSAYNSYKVSSDQVNLTAARDLSANVRLTLAAGLDDGEVGAAGFSADTDTQAFGLGLSFIPASKGWTADLGVALTRTDWTAARGAVQSQQDNEDGLGVALRLALTPTVNGSLSYAPYIGLSYATQEMGAVSEDADAAGVGVDFAGYDRDSLVSELGLKAEYALKPGTTLTGVLAWEHEFENSGETTLDAEFTDDGVSDTRFAVTSAGFGADIFRLGVGVRVDLGAKAAFSLGYDALLSSESKSGQGIKADVAFRF